MIAKCLIATPLRLSAVWRPAVLKHLLSLSRDDRYGRFASPLPDEGVAAYVERIDFRKDCCFAILEPDSQLSGFIHLVVHGAFAELGASVLAARRRQGCARLLFRSALSHAREGGIHEIHLATGHPAARRICAGLGYGLASGEDYPRVRINLQGAK